MDNENNFIEIFTHAETCWINQSKIAITHFVLDEHISALLKTRDSNTNKGDYGHAMMMAGSYGKMGAAVLASKACLRSGVGLLTTYIPKCGFYILQIGVPEAMCLADTNSKYLSQIPQNLAYQAIGIGPGIGKEKETVACLKSTLENYQKPMVIDADALNILSENRELIKLIPKGSILTPHVKEFERLVGIWDTLRERFNKQKQFAQETNCIVVVKDAKTCICSPEGDFFINIIGNAGMATGGSGDVLTGIITGLLAQGYESLDAALIGVYFHALAGDSAAKQKGMNALIASDIVDCLRIERD